MKNFPNILRFLVVFLLSYIILSLLPFAQPLRTATVGFYNVFPNKKSIRASFILNQNARLTAFGPFIMLLGLIIASPVHWKRKSLAAIIGSLVLFILLSMKYTAMIDANAPILRPQGWSTWVNHRTSVDHFDFKSQGSEVVFKIVKYLLTPFP